MTGHVSGLPVEEVLPALTSGSGAVLLLLASLGTRLRSSRARRRRTAPGSSAANRARPLDVEERVAASSLM